MTFVIISGGIDLSVGSLLALSAVLAAYGSQYGSVVAVALPLVVCGLIGLVNGLLIARARMAAFIVTLAALLFARGLAFAVSDEGNTIFHIDDQLAVIWLGQGSLVGIRVPIIIAAVAFVVGWVVLTRTRYGMAVTAIGGSEDAARLMGLPIARVKTAMYLTSGLLAGPRRRAGGGSLVVGPVDDRGRPRAAGDRRRRDRRDAADRRLGVDDRHARRGAPAQRHQQRHQPGRDAQLLLPAGGERRVPDHRRADPALPQSGAAAMTGPTNLRFGLFLSQARKAWDQVLDEFLEAEELGFDHAWLVDHLVDTDGAPEDGCLEAWTLLAAIAAKTKRIRLGVLVSSNTFRHPAILLKEAVTVDHISGGRLILGIGTGLARGRAPPLRHRPAAAPRSGSTGSRRRSR